MCNILDNEGRLENIKSKFFKLPTNAKQVKFILQMLTRRNWLPEAKIVCPSKNDAKALAARRLGNELFLVNNYVGALRNYNRCLCFSTSGSENLSLAFANRSAVYFNCGHYKECLENIELAIENHYPQRLLPKLLKRKMDCVNRMNNNTNHESLDAPVSLSYKPNPKIPSIVEGIEFCKNKKFGRHLVAKRDFNPGDVLIVEDAFAAGFKEKFAYFYCMNCMKSKLMNLIPCSISSSTMFCSTKCRNDAWERFYKYEAPVTDGIQRLFEKLLMNIRTVLIGFSLFPSVDELQVFIESIKGKDVTVFAAEGPKPTDKELFSAVYSFASGEEQFDKKIETFYRGAMSAMAYHILMSYTQLNTIVQTDSHKELLMDLLFHFHKGFIHHCHVLYGRNHTAEENMKHDWDGIGMATFPISSYINHSCAPNVFRKGEFHNIMVAFQPIKAGEQIFDSYVPIYTMMERAERQKLLLEDHGVQCECIACVKNYPKLQSLPRINYDMNKLESLRMVPLHADEKPEACKKLHRMCIRFLKKYFHHFPCFEYSQVQLYLLLGCDDVFLPTPLYRSLKRVESP